MERLHPELARPRHSPCDLPEDAEFQGLLDMLIRDTAGTVDLSSFFLPSNEQLEDAGFHAREFFTGSASPLALNNQHKVSHPQALLRNTSSSAATGDHWDCLFDDGTGTTRGAEECPSAPLLLNPQLAHTLSSSSVTSHLGLPQDTCAVGAETAKKAVKMTPQQRFKIRQKEKHAAMLDQLRQLEEQARLYTARNTDLYQRTRVLQKMLELRDGQLEMIKISDEPDLPNARGDSFFSPNFLQPQIIKNLTLEEFASHWRDLLGQLSEWLVRAELHPADDAANHQLNQLVSAVGWLTQHMWLLNWSCMREALGTDLQEMVPGTPQDMHWQHMVAALQLTEQQKVDICTIRQIYTDFLNSWLNDRQALLGQVCQLSSQGLSMPWSDVPQQLEHTARTVEVIESLDKLTRRQATAYLLTCGTLFGRVLTPLQTAKACLYSMPFIPDAIATIAMVANHRPMLNQPEMMPMIQPCWAEA